MTAPTTALQNLSERSRRSEIKAEVQKEKPFRVTPTIVGRRLLLEVVNLLFNHDFFWKFLGHLNGSMKFLEAVFLVYPADLSYTLSYYSLRRAEKIRWSPWFAGLLWQNGKFTLMFSITATQSEFTSPENDSRLRGAMHRIEELMGYVQVSRVTSAGILPSFLLRNRIIRKAAETEVTIMALERALHDVEVREHMPDNIPVVVIGGRGHIGRRFVGRLTSRVVYSIEDVNEWPRCLMGKRILVVDASEKDAINEYIPLMWPRTVVMNEVYPEPSAEALMLMRERGVTCYHVVGVEGHAVPAFPNAYEGAIPCCAAWPSAEMKAVVRKLC